MTMIEDKIFAEKQVKRMGQLKGYPREREPLRELCFALMAFPTQEKATAYVTDIIGHESTCPLPSSIRIAAYETKQVETASWLEKKKCPDCSGSGYRMVTLMQQAVPGMARALYDFAVPCQHTGETSGG